MNDSAFNAIVSASVVLLDLAYGIPIAINCIRGRNTLPERAFVLSNWVGWTLNIVRPFLDHHFDNLLTHPRSPWSTFL